MIFSMFYTILTLVSDGDINFILKNTTTTGTSPSLYSDVFSKVVVHRSPKYHNIISFADLNL
jgi:hypothetical protein